MKVELIWIDAYACFILCVPPPQNPAINSLPRVTKTNDIV